MDPEWITASATLGGAIGTFGTLLAAIVVLRVEQKERMRSEVRGVHCWLEWEFKTPPDARIQQWLKGKCLLNIVAENAGDQMIFDIRGQVAHQRQLEIGRQVGGLSKLLPREKHTLDLSIEIPIQRLENRPSHSTGAEILFTDGRGRRWHRDPYGRLRLAKPLRWWALWRAPHPLEVDWEILHRWRRSLGEGRSYDFPTYPYNVPWWAPYARYQKWRHERKSRGTNK